MSDEPSVAQATSNNAEKSTSSKEKSRNSKSTDSRKKSKKGDGKEAPPKKETQKQKKGRKPKCPNYNEEEQLLLVECFRHFQPDGSLKWNLLSTEYNATKPAQRPARTADDLKRKFKRMVATKKPTGDPSCPESIRQAKRAWREMENNLLVAQDSDLDGSSSAESEENSKEQEDQDDPEVGGDGSVNNEDRKGENAEANKGENTEEEKPNSPANSPVTNADQKKKDKKRKVSLLSPSADDSESSFRMPLLPQQRRKIGTDMKDIKELIYAKQLRPNDTNSTDIMVMQMQSQIAGITTQVQSQIGGITTQVQSQISNIQSQILSQLQPQFSRFESRLDSLQNTVGKLENSVGKLESSIEFMKQQHMMQSMLRMAKSGVVDSAAMQ